MLSFDVSPNLNDFGWCPFARVTGEPCILCGGTRATISLLAGDPESAVRYNAVVTGLIVGSFLLMSAWGVMSVTGRRAGSEAIPWGALRTRGVGRQFLVVEVAFFSLWWVWNLGRW
jgi:hypothetical protein